MTLTWRQLQDEIQKLTATKVGGAPEYREWFRFEDALNFLTLSSWNLVPMFISVEHVYLYSVLVPETALSKDYVNDIMHWSLPPVSGWKYSVSLDAKEAKEASLAPLLELTESRVLDQGEPIVFLRYFEGRRGKKSYPELNQRIVHVLDVHWVEERSAYCRLNELGDFDDLIPIKNDDEGTLVAITLDALEPYMLLTDSVLIRLFDFVRCEDSEDFVPKKRKETYLKSEETGIHARLLTILDNTGPRAAKLRGFQIIHRRKNDATLLKILKGEGVTPRRYESFIAVDYKHREIHECSCEPTQLGNYFVPSDLPYETSPAFFRPEVLLRYKQDPDKYQLESRMITCRGGWHLPYDINDEGQVHVYLVDLARLPYAEQVYWKAFNERPKSGISRRAWTTDFLAEFDTEYDSLSALASVLKHFPITSMGMAIWKPDERALSRLTHVVTDSKKEWEDAILNLAKLIVDGLQESCINRIAKDLNCFEKGLRSIKQLQRCLEKSGVDTRVVTTIIEPLTELWTIRSSGGIAHRGEANIHDTKQHFDDLLNRCDKGMRKLADLIERGALDVPHHTMGDEET